MGIKEIIAEDFSTNTTRNKGRCSSSHTTSRDWLATLLQNNRTNNRTITLETIATATQFEQLRGFRELLHHWKYMKGNMYVAPGAQKGNIRPYYSMFPFSLFLGIVLLYCAFFISEYTLFYNRSLNWINRAFITFLRVLNSTPSRLKMLTVLF